MAYFKDIFDLLLLKEEAYRRVGNDRKTFGKFTIAFLLSHYLSLLLGGIFLTIVGGIVFPQFLDLIMENTGLLVILYLIIPFLLYGLTFLLTGIPYTIGLLCGGRPRRYSDFLKVWLYPYTFLAPLMFIPGGSIISTLYNIWSFFTLYKTYKIIHRLTPRKAGCAVAVNIVISMFFILIVVIFFSFYAAKNPQVFIK